MASSRYSTPPAGFVRVESMRSNASSGYQSRAKSSNFDAMSETISFTSESPWARFQDQLHELAAAASIPLTLPKPMLSHPSQRAIPQNPSDKEGAEALLMSLRPKKFLVGKSSKGFSSDEIMLGLDRAVKDKKSARIVEALLQLAESVGVIGATSSAAFTSGKKGHAIPTMDYVFSQTEHPRPPEVWQQFLGRVSQRALDTSLAGALKNTPMDVARIRALLEYGANPELCQDRILALVSSSDSENTIETILLSPSITNSEFLNQALIQATSAGSLRNVAMLLLRGADANFNHGDAIKVAVSKRSYNIALALAYLSKQPISSSILDDCTGAMGSWSQEVQKHFLTMLLYAGACGPRTSRTVLPYVTNKDGDIVSFLVDTLAFSHGSFPSSKLFQAAVESRDTALALSVLRSSKYRSFSDYASTGVHLQLVQNYTSNPGESLELIAELLALGVAGDYSSQMLVKSCESEQIESPEIMVLINLLVQSGGAKATYLDGKCLLLAIEAAQPAVVKALISAQPSKKILNAAISHANSSLRDGDPAKLEIWSILLQAGASGGSVDQQLVAAIDSSPKALEKIKALLPAASLDYSDGEAIVKAIQLERFDILEICLGVHRPQSSLPSIWKQTRRLFDIAGNFPYNLPYVQKTLWILYNAGKHAAPLDDLLHDATQCRSNETALALSSQLLRWGASPNHALGVSLLACIGRSDAKTLATLLSHSPSKTSLKYAFEEALSLRKPDRYEILKMIVEAGVEKASLDAALPRILKEDNYESATAHLLVSSGARLHSALSENLIPPAKYLDLPIVEALIPKTGQKENLILPLKALFISHRDWQVPDGKSLQMVKLLLASCSKGTWADQVFIAQVKELNQHAANLFMGHLTSRQILSDALYELLRQDKGNLSREKLSMATHLLNQGARHDIVDGVFLRSAQKLSYEWVTSLNPYLLNPAVRLSAFEAVMSQEGRSLGGNKLEIVQFLLKNGVKGPSADAAFVKSAAAGDLEGMNYFLPFVSSKDSFSQALGGLTANSGLASTNDGRAAIKVLLGNGASGASVLNSAAAAAKAHSLDGVKLTVGDSQQESVSKAAFEGLLAAERPLSSPTGLSILSYLVENGLGCEDAMKVARVAASRHDIPLMKSVEPLDKSRHICDVALDTVARSGGQWISAEGLSFVEYLITRGASGSAIHRMIETAAKSQVALPVLRLLLPVCGDRQHAAGLAFASLASDIRTSLSPEKLSVVDFLLCEGAKGRAVEQLAINAAEMSNYDALDVFLRSAIASSVIPAAFRAVARNKSKHLSSEQLSIASILVKHGVSTEVLAIASVEATKLLDLEALKVLSTSPRFPSVTDDTLRALLLSEDLWRSPGGLSIMQYLLESGVSPPTAELAASKAAGALDVDVLRVVLDSKQSPEIVEAAFSSMTGLEKEWLSPEGLRIAELLLPMNLSQTSIDKAFIQACQHLHHDAVQLLYPYIIDVLVFNTALAKATGAEAGWLTELRIIERLLDSGVEGEAIESALIKGAQALNYECLQLLSPRVDRWEVYSKALTAAQTTKNWRQSLKVIEFLLNRGASGEPVDTAFISTAGSLDYRATSLLADHVDNQNANCEAFTAATTNGSWLLPSHQDLLSLLYRRGVSSNVVKPALVVAAEALNAPIVELLAQNANICMASAAFASATAKGNDWVSDEGTSVLDILVRKGAQGESVEQALISSAQQLRLDIVNILVPNIDEENVQCFSSAFDAVVTNRDMWLSHPEALDIIQIFIEKGASAESAHNSLVDAAEAGNYDAVNILAQVVDNPTVYTEAFDVLTQTESLWLQDETQELLATLLSRGASGDCLHISLINAVQEVIQGVASDTLVTLLLDHGADVNFGNGRALQFAARYGRLDLFDLLLSYGPDAITLYMGMREALCTGHGEELALDFLIAIFSNDSLEVEPDVNHDSSLGWPLIFYCLRLYPSSVDLAKALCDRNADLTTTMPWSIYEGEDEPNFPPVPEDEITPLLFAIEKNASDEVILDVLLAYGAEHEYVPKHSQATALVLAARNDRTLILSTLLDLGARVEQIDCFDHSPLFYAGRNGNLSAITSLLKKYPPANDGSLHEAARELHSDAVKLLVAAGHEINYPSLKHAGRSPLCELCYKCRAATNPVGLQNTLSTIMGAKATPLRKYRGKTPLFFAMENEDPVPVVLKLIAVSLWQDLNDPANVIEEDSHFYSPTMYIKKGLCPQTESKSLEVLTVLEDASAEDRFYAKERMRQPEDAIGMPQRIADLDRKKWIRSSRLEEEQEDHQRKLRREMEEMAQRDNLTTQRHLLTMEHREDVALQTTNITSDSRWQDLQFRSIEHAQASRYKDDLLDHRLDEVAGTHRLKFQVDQQVRGTLLQHETQVAKQKLGYLGEEQNLKFEGAQAQQHLRLEGISTENSMKGEALSQDLWFKEARGGVDRADMDYRLQHTVDMNLDRISTQERLEDVARSSQQRKNCLDQESQQLQLGFQTASEDRKLMTENSMNQYRRSNNDDTIRTRDTLGQIETRTMQDKHQLQEHDRQNQMRFNAASDRQKLGTLTETGRITNNTLYQKGQIENDSLRDKNELMHQNRNNELQHTADMGYQRTENERSLGQQRYTNERDMGQIKVTNERNMGQQKVTNEHNMGNARANSEKVVGNQKVVNENRMGNARANSERVVGNQKVSNENRMGGARANSERLVGNQKVANENRMGGARANSEKLVGYAKSRTARNVNDINNRGAAYRESLKHRRGP